MLIIMKMLYIKNCDKIHRFVFRLSAILKIAANMVAILKNKVDEDAPLIAKILNAKNGVEIRCCLGVKGAQTDRHTDRQTHGMTESPHL